MEAKIAQPFRVWRGDYPITDWLDGWSEELVDALGAALDKAHKWDDYYDTRRISEELDETHEPEDEDTFLEMARAQLALTTKRKESALEKKLKQYNKLKQELGL